MKTTDGNKGPLRHVFGGSLILLVGALLAAGLAQVGCGGKAGSPAPSGKAFDSPQQAAEALVGAAERFDVAALDGIFGPDGRDIVITGESVRDREQAAKFAALAREKNRIAIDPQNPKRATFLVGGEDLPLPVPIVEIKGKWYFDAAAGREEILYERIGDNELTAIEICRGFVEAQHEYALEKHDGSAVNQYARRIISSPGMQDGLAWQNPDGTWGGPAGEEIARAIDQGLNAGEPFHGYYFKVLTGQGPDAPLGEMDFLIEGAMIGGFALIAAPAQYGVTGVKTFMVSHDGVVYEKDLGSTTLDQAKTIERYNPDASWQPVQER